jgi:bifunctional non-homologous end joining protein LigD
VNQYSPIDAIAALTIPFDNAPVGAVGTGRTEAEALALMKRLDALAIREVAVVGAKGEGAVWTAPDLRAKVAYCDWTSGEELRQASFKGLREE